MQIFNKILTFENKFGVYNILVVSSQGGNDAQQFN